uniref:Uncharacterized protein n=1 Tax=Oryza sativa subsp. japonica TaxID=39947 RepID=Q6Z4U5_ORYSJ|nr:hypothetical protein [Oryza sativa Japonica Group]
MRVGVYHPTAALVFDRLLVGGLHDDNGSMSYIVAANDAVSAAAPAALGRNESPSLVRQLSHEFLNLDNVGMRVITNPSNAGDVAHAVVVIERAASKEATEVVEQRDGGRPPSCSP